MPTVYLGTTIPSYLVARPSRDLVVAAHQQITQEWWATARDRFEILVSEAVIDEIGNGDSEWAAKRLELARDLPFLASSEDVVFLFEACDSRLLLPERARADLAHIAFAVAYRLDFLVTWNCKHIANAAVVRRLLAINGELGRATPLIVTPEELLEFAGEVEP
jgi:hypothetical protein